MATYLTRTPASAGNRKTFTISAWFKKNPLVVQNIMYSNVSQESVYQFTSTGQINYYEYSGGYTSRLLTNALLRDSSAWYHIVLAVDTTQATSSNRLKMYVNGEQVTSFSAATYPSQNFESYNINNNSLQTIGANNGNDGFSGSMSHFNFIDGTAYDASAFGSTDATTGEWKINTSPSVTYGTNGFFILKDGNSVTDQSGNSNNFTVAGGTLTNTEDCPDNVFATLNPLNAFYTNDTFSNGNNTVVTGSSTTGSKATFVINTGKFYWEVKVISKTAGIDEYLVGIVGSESVATNNFVGQGSDGYGYYGASGAMYNNAASSSYGASYTAGDILGVALDCTNSKLYISKNGAYQASGNPTAGSGGLTIVAPSATGLGGYYPSATLWNTNSATFSYNFGNGTFGTTAVASAGTNASSNGVFEYDVPTGYTALSTKGLNL